MSTVAGESAREHGSLKLINMAIYFGCSFMLAPFTASAVFFLFNAKYFCYPTMGVPFVLVCAAACAAQAAIMLFAQKGMLKVFKQLNMPISLVLNLVQGAFDVYASLYAIFALETQPNASMDLYICKNVLNK